MKDKIKNGSIGAREYLEYTVIQFCVRRNTQAVAEVLSIGHCERRILYSHSHSGVFALIIIGLYVKNVERILL